MKKNSVKEEKGSFFEHSEKDLSKDRIGSILLDIIIRIRRTHFYQKYSVYIIGLIIGLMIYSMIKDVDDSILNIGVPPQMGIKGIFFHYFCYIGALNLKLKLHQQWDFLFLFHF